MQTGEADIVASLRARAAWTDEFCPVTCELFDEAIATIEALRAEIAERDALLREAREALSGMTHETESLVPVSDLNHDAAAGILDRAARARETLMRLDTIIAKQGEGK